MATSPLFGWEEPDDTDLVKDGAAAIRTLGNAIDTSMGDLLGGTTGQVLSKASNTDMDFSWVAADDTNAIQNTIVDAKGDLIAASAADTPARLAVGNNGETLVADSSASVGLSYKADFAAGKNVVINGDFRINQRAFTSTTASGAYTFDRWVTAASDGTSTFTAQTFTLGTAPVTGYEARNFIDVASTGQTAASAITLLGQRIESVRTFANQTVVVSFWAKAASGSPKVAVELSQNFGTGGSPSTAVNTYAGQVTLTTSWARYSVSVALPSISGKTLGTANDDQLRLTLWTSAGTDFNARTGSLGIQTTTISFWGVQLEAGSVATAFQTATGTLAGELAACQRYYFRNNSGSTNYSWFAWGIGQGSSQALFSIPCPVTMRTTPTVVEFANLGLAQTGGINAITTLVHANSSPSAAFLQSNGTNTADVFYRLIANNSSSAYVGIGAEL